MTSNKTWAFVTLCLLSGSPAPGVAATLTVDADCTLIDAVQAAETDSPVNACPAGDDADTIALSADVVLTEPLLDRQGPTALPVITSTVTIQGNGFTIRRANDAPRFRLFYVDGGDLTLEGLTLANGSLDGEDGENGENGWLQRLDTVTGEADGEVAASVAVPVRDLAVLGDGALALASGVAGLPLLVLDGQFAPRCQAEAARDVALPSITPDAGGFLYLAGQRPSSGRAQLWVYDNQCQRRQEVPLDFPDSRFLAASVGVDNRLSLVGERNGDPLAVDLNSGRAF